METLRLRKLQQAPSHVGRLLEALIAHGNLVPAGAHQIRNLGEVPRELQTMAEQAGKKGRVWSCWAHTFRTWMFTAEMPLSLSRERGTPVLQVDLYDEDGLKDSGLWTSDRQGKWSRCSD